MKRLLILSVIASTGLLISVDVLAWNSLNYEQAAARCERGDRRACAVYQRYQQWERDRRRGRQGSPADNWVSPDELKGDRPGLWSPGELVR